MDFKKDVFIKQGILDCQVDQLINYSQTDPDVKKFTSDSVRFRDLSSFKKWLIQGRIIYTISDINQNLLGIIWFGQKNPPIDVNANFTFAIRIYGAARGHGLSQNFMKTAFTDLLQNQKQSRITGFWLATSKNNFTAIHTYEKFGFKKNGEIDGENIMVLPLPDVN